ncbi:MAG TPA: DUF3302 domain-containing protein [Steroidobacteraceae bacterium]|nr:DUF3302 domain-containing protein [Steroidobacteraceae bacterium]
MLTSLLFVPTHAHASFLHGEALDTVADVMAWVVLIIAPTVGIVVFWLVHILPEKIAEKRQHPQTGAIQTLCLLSLVFGGLLWPIAWLWAYSKPVLYKMAYGTDKVPHGHDDSAEAAALTDEAAPHTDEAAPHTDEAAELLQLRERVAELEARSTGRAARDT